MATLDDAVSQMLANGMPPLPDGTPRVNTGRVIRYGPKKRAWYRLFDTQGKNGRSYISGAYGIWGRLDKTKIETDWTGIDEAERARIQREQKAVEQREEEKRQLRAQNAANRAREQYMASSFKGESPYLKAKGVEPDKGLRYFSDGTLLVPMLRYDAEPKPELKGLQKIAPDGQKRFNKGMAKEGTAFLLGAKPKKGEPILITEGLATGLSIRAGVGRSRPVFIAFDAYNLLPAAKLIRSKYPDSLLVFCADDDYLTAGNPGKTKAEQAAQAIGNAIVTMPEFEKRMDQPWTDFNDLHKHESLTVLERQLTKALATFPAAAAPPKKPRVPVDWDAFEKMLQRFTLIYPSDTAWDDRLGQIVKIEHIRNAFGKALVNIWQASGQRKTVTTDMVVFDPAGKVDPEKSVNLFRGMPMKPNADASCSKLIELLFYLCGEDQALFTWVLKWTAYPLQHRGAKMRTAVVMYGGEGAGKNIFWGAVRDIYGVHGGIITQMQLQSQFNDWLSAKLFLVANEVVTRQEIKHHVGYLKNLITEPEVLINPKNMPLRREANFANLVFLSNELQPLLISPDDRRNQVIRTPPIQSAEYYKDVAAELSSGGVEALYHYLLELDLGDFNEHTKPLMTDAKRDLIDLGKSSTQLFWTELHDGMLPLPYIPCLQADLFRGYLRWCVTQGEKMPTRKNRFSHEFMAMNGVRKRVKRVPDPGDDGEKLMERSLIPQKTVFLMGDQPPGEADEFEWLKKNVEQFRSALNDYTGSGA